MLARLKYPALTFLASFVVLFYFYHTVILSPNSYLFAASGDGIKNYYTYLWHIDFDPSFWEFTGMNYPFGENIVYADAHPLLSWIIRGLGLNAYAVGILNILMLLSWPVCSVFLFKILRHYKVDVLWSILSAVAITFMAPQVFRLTGHFSLSYVFAVPVMWYLLIKVGTGRKYLWSAVIGLFLLAFFFTHPYFAIILAFMAFFYWALHIVRDRKERKLILTYFAFIGLQILAPFILFQLGVSLTDTHENRTNNPAGFFFYHASWRSVLVPEFGPIGHFVREWKIEVSHWEGRSYIGLTSIIIAIYSLWYAFKNRANIQFKKLFGSELFLFVFASTLILIFSFCFPFKYDFMKWVVDMLGPLKQFRVLGRFTWIFFFVFTVFCIVMLYRLKQKSEKTTLYNVLFFVGIAFFFIEAHEPHKVVASAISHTPNEFQRDQLTDELRETVEFVEQNDYDAILFVPFVHLSSEVVFSLGTEEASHDVWLMSYHTETPTLNAIVGRMSIDEAFLFQNLFSPEFMEKELCNIIGYDKKIALIKNQSPLSFPELQMCWTSDQVFKNDIYTVFDLDLEKWNSPRFFNDLLVLEDSLNSDFHGDLMHHLSVDFTYEGFEDQGHEGAFFGSGALSGEKNGFNVVYEVDANQLFDSAYVASFWYSTHVDRPDVTIFVEEVYSDERGTIWADSDPVRESNEIVRGWCRTEVEFRKSENLEKIRLIISGNGSGEFFVVDELLIQTKGSHLFRRESVDGVDYLVYNNHWLRADSFK